MTFDIIAILATFIAAILWLAASGKTLRRINRAETIDEHDLNRLIVAFNRNQILNARAALASAVAAAAIGARFLVDFLGA